MGAPLLSAALCSREVAVRIRAAASRRITALVPPAPVSAVAALAEVGADAALGDADAWALLADACRGWLPLSLRSALFSASVFADAEGRRDVLEQIGRLVARGVPETEEAEAAEQKLKLKAEASGWPAVVAAYRSEFGTDPLPMPYGQFVLEWKRLDALSAHRELAHFRAATLSNPHLTPEAFEEQYDALLARAGVDPESLEAQRFEAKLERQRKELPGVIAKIGALTNSGALA